VGHVIVDTHVHFWDPRALRYPWLEQIPVLAHPFLPDDYVETTAGLPIEKMILVECDCERSESARELQLFERLIQSDRRIAGIVAFVDLTNTRELERTLDAAASVKHVKGIRHNIQGEPPGFCVQPSFVAGVRSVGERGLTFDLCVTHDQLGDVIQLVEACPDTRFVLDHCAKPAIRALRRDPWRGDLARLADLENVSCKISGLLTEADHRRWREEDVMPYAMHAVDCFGTERVMYGSDWPVLTLAGEYGDWLDITQHLTESWSDGERNAFYGGNAERIYGL
jgi:predicted TIM-barrel fold metal-dependent hydrolase